MNSFEKKSQDENNLKNRLKINKKTQKKNFQEYFSNQLDINKNKFILDLGCGHGQFSKYILKTKLYKKLYSTDINPKFINNLKKLKNKFINFYPILMDINKMKFKKNYFDLIIASYSIYYSKDIKKIIDKLLSYLDQNGEIIIANPYKPHFMVNLVTKIHEVDKKIIESISISDQIIHYLRKNKNIKIVKKIFKNETTLSKRDILDSYLNSTMYNANKLKEFKLKLSQFKKEKFKFIKRTCILKIKKFKRF